MCRVLQTEALLELETLSEETRLTLEVGLDRLFQKLPMTVRYIVEMTKLNDELVSMGISTSQIRKRSNLNKVYSKWKQESSKKSNNHARFFEKMI